MENEHLHLPDELAQLIAYILFGLALLYLLVFSFKEGKAVIKDFKGKDNMWQFIETAAYIWIILFTTASLADIFLGFHASGSFWASLDTIFLVLTGGKVALEHVRKPKISGNKQSESLGKEDDG